MRRFSVSNSRGHLASAAADLRQRLRRAKGNPPFLQARARRRVIIRP
jgi:hypothetical protein